MLPSYRSGDSLLHARSYALLNGVLLRCKIHTCVEQFEARYTAFTLANERSCECASHNRIAQT